MPRTSSNRFNLSKDCLTVTLRANVSLVIKSRGQVSLTQLNPIETIFLEMESNGCLLKSCSFWRRRGSVGVSKNTKEISIFYGIIINLCRWVLVKQPHPPSFTVAASNSKDARNFSGRGDSIFVSLIARCDCF